MSGSRRGAAERPSPAGRRPRARPEARARGEGAVKVWRRRRRRRRWWPAVVLAFLVLAALSAAEAARLAPAYSDLREGQGALQDAAGTLGLTPEQWTPERLAAAAELQKEGDIMVHRGQAVIASDPVVGLALQLPWVGAQARAATDLANAGVGVAAAMADVTSVARVYEGETHDTAAPGPKLLHLLEAAGGPLQHAHRTLGPKLDALRGDLDQPLVGPLRSQVQRSVDALTPLDDMAAAGGTAGRLAPGALGADGPRTYLVLLLNPSEMRPDGGFAGAVGTVVFDQGAPREVTVVPQEVVNQHITDRFDIPTPLGRYLSFYRDSLEIGDAGWDPDFPTDAALSERMYTAATGRGVDGTIALDPLAVQALLKVTGPVSVPGYGAFTADDFFYRLDVIVNAGQGPRAGKQALGPVAGEVIRRALEEPVGRWPQLLGAFQAQARQRHVQVFVHQPDLALAAARVHYDGAVLRALADYLLVADANVGQTKGDRYLRKSITAQADVGSDGSVHHHLALDYRMPLPTDAVDRALNPFDGSYKDYLRIYVPANAALSSLSVSIDGARGGGGLQGISFEHGWEVLAVYFRLPRGHTAEVAVDYQSQVPATSAYSLYLQKQAGSLATPTTVSVAYPGGKLTRSLSLQTDDSVDIRW